ncbi:hypothetical protein IQ255_20255 [Pleurocapsales cyanobacterium LEGE 10410]|nr:hypothetical protein [Pleurocapsales cyanobacterium LEGE 10410]
MPIPPGIKEAWQAINVLMGVNETRKRLARDKQYEEIINKYELGFCDSIEEFFEKYEELEPHEQTIIHKCCPEFREILKWQDDYMKNSKNLQ